MTPPKNILIVRTDRIGDVVLSLPIAQIIKKHFTGIKVTYLLREYTKVLAENNPNIDEIITLIETNGKIPLFQNLQKLKKINMSQAGGFDTCIIAYPTFKIALILSLLNIGTRIGTGYRWYSFLFNKRIFEHRKFAEWHELEYNIRLLNSLGIEEDVSPSNVAFNLHASQNSKQIVNDKLKSSGFNFHKKTIMVHPGSGGSSMDLPIAKMKDLLYHLAYKLDVEILITGSKDEKELCESLVVSGKTRNLAGEFELTELIALIDKADLLIANSTGPIHIAAALGKYVIGFYPKIISCSYNRWGPYTEKKIIFTPMIDCKECTRKQCEKLNCMTSIDINQVFESVQNIIGQI